VISQTPILKKDYCSTSPRPCSISESENPASPLYVPCVSDCYE